MRRAFLACLATVVLGSPALAQGPPRFNLIVQDVRVGFPGGSEADGAPGHLFKAGT